uniref:Methyl-accepting transducer domain-containing protein n=1 Tax=Fervidobacterium pennivorans TaxID=93466 RepID=A0A7V4NG00_FERPE
MKNKSRRAALLPVVLLPVVFLVLVVLGLFSIYFEVLYVTEKVNDEWFEKTRELIYAQIETLVKSTHFVKATVDIILSDKRAIELFKKRDRQGLYNYLLPLYENLKSKGIGQLHFINADLTSFLRFHKPELYGDDLSFRKMLVKVKETKKELNGAEPGIIGLVLRAISPVIVDGEFIGIVEAGIIYDKSLLEDLEKALGGHGELIILYDHLGKLEKPTIIKTDDTIEIMNEIDFEKFLSDERYFVFRDGYLYLSTHFKNIDGETVAVLLFKIPLQDIYAQQVNAKRLILVGISAVTVILAFMSIILYRNTKEQITFSDASAKLIQDFSENIIQTSSSASEIKAMAENTESAVTDVDKALQEFSNYIEESRAETEATLKGLAEFTSTIEQITEYTSKLATLTETLSSLSEKITDISDNITVLAINVSIETSKENIDKEGLARIAEMIMELSNSARNLAKESKHSLENVENIITSTTLITEKVVKRISSVRESIDNIRQVSEASVTNVEKLVNASRLAHESVEELYSGIEQLEEAILKIKESVENFRVQIREHRSSSAND